MTQPFEDFTFDDRRDRIQLRKRLAVFLADFLVMGWPIFPISFLEAPQDSPIITALTVLFFTGYALFFISQNILVVLCWVTQGEVLYFNHILLSRGWFWVHWRCVMFGIMAAVAVALWLAPSLPFLFTGVAAYLLYSVGLLLDYCQMLKAVL
ncbi:MAG: hypothetical protein HYV26_22775 [Candidatus Hydrogenedentes bacterium]|nr:hypothetical protein [Candidatus Hydrogenedentota bacterium]